jgi:hypothetical protein
MGVEWIQMAQPSGLIKYRIFLPYDSLLLFSIVKIGLQQFSWTTNTSDIR